MVIEGAEVVPGFIDAIHCPTATATPVLLVIADVMGKGVPAALLMANLQACFRSQEPESLLEPGRVLESVNRHFFDSTAAERFATLVFAVYDDATRQTILKANGLADDGSVCPDAINHTNLDDWKEFHAALSGKSTSSPTVMMSVLRSSCERALPTLGATLPGPQA